MPVAPDMHMLAHMAKNIAEHMAHTRVERTLCGAEQVLQVCDASSPFCFADNQHCCGSAAQFCPGKVSPMRLEQGVACFASTAACRLGDTAACAVATDSCARFLGA
jgi:hypothetical protein